VSKLSGADEDDRTTGGANLSTDFLHDAPRSPVSQRNLVSVTPVTISFSRLGNHGRIGNQLWQLAGTLGIARSRGEDVSFPRWAYESVFSVPRSWFNDPVTGTDASDFTQYLGEQGSTYLQDFFLWSNIQDEVREILQPGDLAQTELNKPNYARYFDLTGRVLAVHVRRGDNATAHLRGEQGHHPLRPFQYYEEAIARFPDHDHIVIFSDDIPWCRNAFRDYSPMFFEGGPARPKEHEPEFATAPVLDWIDLLAMTHADYFVMSNSSYSWWGAYLSGTAPENIVYPWPFFGPKLANLQAERMFPPGWQRLDHGRV